MLILGYNAACDTNTPEPSAVAHSKLGINAVVAVLTHTPAAMQSIYQDLTIMLPVARPQNS